MKKIFFLLCLASLLSCEDDPDIIIDSDNLLIGNWVKPVYDNGETTYQRVLNLPEEDFGLSFKSNGDFIWRSSGFCGTPPLFFFDEEGTWTKNDDNIISITKPSFPMNYTWEIITLTETKLTIKTVLSDQEKEHQALMDLYNEIYDLSYSVSCTDANNWDFTAYGSKACGGPQGYIAYPKTIDVEAFLQKVANYTEAENAFNIKWGIVSTCDIPQQPSGVTCENGYPVLQY